MDIGFIKRLKVFAIARSGLVGRRAPVRLRLGIIKQKVVRINRVELGRGTRIIEDWCWKNSSGTFDLVPENEPNPHILIVGMSGYGKSTLCKSLIKEICGAGKRVMVFDVHNEHIDVIRSVGGEVRNALYVGINILALDGASVAERISDLVDLFTDVYRLGNVQATMLGECLWYTYRKFGAYTKAATRVVRTPTIFNLLEEIGVFIKLARTSTEKNTLQSIRSKVATLNNDAFNKNFITLEQLKNSVSSFSLAKLKSREARAIYINELLKRLYLSMKENEREQGVSYYIMIDEAQFLIGGGGLAGEMIKRLTEEGRKYGVGLIVATHSASNLDKQIVANAATFISFHSREPDEVDYVSNLLAGGQRTLGERIRSALSTLRQHEALVIKMGLPGPLLIKTATATEVGAQIDGRKFVEEEREKETREKIFVFAHKPVTKALLCSQFGAEAERLAEEMVSEGRMERLALGSEEKPEVWYADRIACRSIEHEVYIRKISMALAKKKIENTVTSSTPNPDIIVKSHDIRIAVEYETGKKDRKETEAMLARRSEYKRIVIFVSDAHFEEYKKNFQSERVRVLRMKELQDFVDELSGSGKPDINILGL